MVELKEKIEAARGRIDELLEQKAEMHEIQKASEELDRLIEVYLSADKAYS